MFKKMIAVLLLSAMLFTVCSFGVHATLEWQQLVLAYASFEFIEETYNDYARCEFVAFCRESGYTIDATFRLYQDDADYACWEYDEEESIDDVKTYPITHGHDYFLGMHIRVYDSYGNFIEEYIDYTDVYYF